MSTYIDKIYVCPHILIRREHITGDVFSSHRQFSGLIVVVVSQLSQNIRAGGEATLREATRLRRGLRASLRAMGTVAGRRL